MTRTLHANMLADIAARSAEAVFFLEFQFVTLPSTPATVYFTTAPVDLDWNSQTWQAVGGNLVLEPIVESADRLAAGLQIELNAVDLNIVALVLGKGHRGRLCIITYAHYDPTTGTVISNPLELFRGYMNDSFEIEETRTDELATASIKTRVSSRLVEMSKIKGIRTNPASLQAHQPTDTFFDNTAAIAGRVIFWGRGSGVPGKDGHFGLIPPFEIPPF